MPEEIELPKQKIQKEYTPNIIPELYQKLLQTNAEKINENAANIEKIAITETFSVGDTIEVDGFMGEVVSVGLRTTRIRNYKGATKIIANRNMDNIINYSDHNSLAVVDVGIAYENNEEEIDQVFQKLFQRLKGKIPNATKEPEVWGVNELDDSSVVYRIVVETKPTMQFATERFLRREIKKEFDQSGIKIPYQQIEVHNGK